MSMEAASLALMAAYPVLLAGIANLVGKMVPQPYMDEIFHIPQAQAYCAGIVYVFKQGYMVIYFR